MTYDYNELEGQALKAIKEQNLIFIEEIVSFMDCSIETFYKRKMQESDKIKKAILDNKIRIKGKLRDKMYKAEHPTAWLALYRLSSTTEEHKLLNQTYTDHTTKGEKISVVIDSTESDL